VAAVSLSVPTVAVTVPIGMAPPQPQPQPQPQHQPIAGGVPSRQAPLLLQSVGSQPLAAIASAMEGGSGTEEPHPRTPQPQPQPQRQTRTWNARDSPSPSSPLASLSMPRTGNSFMRKLFAHDDGFTGRPLRLPATVTGGVPVGPSPLRQEVLASVEAHVSRQPSVAVEEPVEAVDDDYDLDTTLVSVVVHSTPISIAPPPPPSKSVEAPPTSVPVVASTASQ
jgi:hypothetical protein